jgi:hypothetical protein
MIQEYNLFESLAAFGNVPPFRCAEGHADHNLSFSRYSQYVFHPIFVESTDPASSIAQIGSRWREKGTRISTDYTDILAIF